MEWLFLLWTFRTASVQAPYPGYAEPAPTDLWLIQLAYRIGMKAVTCGKCGARLGRIQVSPSFRGNLPGWPVLIHARCRGWRRHPHLASVTEIYDGDLRLEPMRIQN
jgi:hypothetical protein